MRCGLGFDLGAPTPDENTIRLFRDKLTDSGALKRVMKAFDLQLRKKGYIPPFGDCRQSPAGRRMSGQIVDASLVPAPKQRNTDGEKEAVKAGKSAKEIWPDEPNKAAQKDTNAPLSWFAGKPLPGSGWTLKVGGKVRYRPDGTPLPMIAVPVFGYKSHIIPTCADHQPWAHSRLPMDMIFQGRSTRLFQASRQSATMSS